MISFKKFILIPLSIASLSISAAWADASWKNTPSDISCGTQVATPPLKIKEIVVSELITKIPIRPTPISLYEKAGSLENVVPDNFTNAAKACKDASNSNGKEYYNSLARACKKSQNQKNDNNHDRRESSCIDAYNAWVKSTNTSITTANKEALATYTREYNYSLSAFQATADHFKTLLLSQCGEVCDYAGYFNTYNTNRARCLTYVRESDPSNTAPDTTPCGPYICAIPNDRIHPFYAECDDQK